MPLPQLGFNFSKAADLPLGVLGYSPDISASHPRRLCGGQDFCF
jgi:hypothetical protein